MSDRSPKSYVNYIFDVLCCCFKSTGKKKKQKRQKGNRIESTYGFKPPEHVDKGLPVRFTSLHFQPINVLPPPEPRTATSIYANIWEDPEYLQIISSEMNLKEKLKRVLKLYEQRFHITPQTHEVRETQKSAVQRGPKRKAPPPPSPPPLPPLEANINSSNDMSPQLKSEFESSEVLKQSNAKMSPNMTRLRELIESLNYKKNN